MDLLSLPASGGGTIVVGIGLFILGYLIKARGWTSLLAGHSPSAVTDEEALATLAGRTVLLVAIIVLVFGGLIVTGLTVPLLETLVTVAILLVVAQYLYRVRRYAA